MKTGYIVAFSSRKQRSLVYRKVDNVNQLIGVLRRVWEMDEPFIVVSIRIYNQTEEQALEETEIDE